MNIYKNTLFVLLNVLVFEKIKWEGQGGRETIDTETKQDKTKIRQNNLNKGPGLQHLP